MDTSTLQRIVGLLNNFRRQFPALQQQLHLEAPDGLRQRSMGINNIEQDGLLSGLVLFDLGYSVH